MAKTSISKKALGNKLDKLFSKVIRKRGHCERCGSTRNLQTAHIFSRTYRNTRWDTSNALCLCAGCHFWGHKNPILFTEFVHEHLGRDNYEVLKEAHNQIYKGTVEDLQIKLKVLGEMYEEHSSDS